jgi:hypothetical protein
MQSDEKQQEEEVEVEVAEEPAEEGKSGDEEEEEEEESLHEGEKEPSSGVMATESYVICLKMLSGEARSHIRRLRPRTTHGQA